LPELLIGALLLKIFKIFKVTLYDRESPVKHLIGLVYSELYKEFVTGCFSYFWMEVVYPIIPWFVTDWVFYGTVYVLPIAWFIIPLLALLFGAAVVIALPTGGGGYAKKND